MIADSNSIIRAHLVTCGTLTALIGGATPRIYCPRLPENCDLPAVSFFTRGGSSNPHIKPIVVPSVQFNCWAKDSAAGKGALIARQVYRALYDSLQGLQNQNVVIGVNTYRILSAREEVQGQDLVDEAIPTYFSTLTFFEVMIAADT